MNITITADFSRIRAQLVEQGRQVDYALARALTDTATGLRDEIGTAARAALDRPRDFSVGRGALRVVPARKDRLSAAVLFKDIQAGYMVYQTDGGTRQPGPPGLRIPGKIPLDSFGNIPRGVIPRLKAVARTEGGTVRRRGKRLGVYRGEEVFLGDPDDHGGRPRGYGLYRIIRRRSGVDSMISLVRFPRVPAQYRRRIDLQAVATDYVSRTFDDTFRRRLTEALASARV